MFAHKKRYFAWAAFAIFLGAQVLVAHHEAEFGPEKHNHHGHPCDIQLFAEHAKAPSVPTMPALPPAVMLARVDIVVERASLTTRDYQPALARAPPISAA